MIMPLSPAINTVSISAILYFCRYSSKCTTSLINRWWTSRCSHIWVTIEDIITTIIDSDFSSSSRTTYIIDPSIKIIAKCIGLTCCERGYNGGHESLRISIEMYLGILINHRTYGSGRYTITNTCSWKIRTDICLECIPFRLGFCWNEYIYSTSNFFAFNSYIYLP